MNFDISTLLDDVELTFCYMHVDSTIVYSTSSKKRYGEVHRTINLKNKPWFVRSIHLRIFGTSSTVLPG